MIGAQTNRHHIVDMPHIFLTSNEHILYDNITMTNLIFEQPVAHCVWVLFHCSIIVSVWGYLIPNTIIFI